MNFHTQSLLDLSRRTNLAKVISSENTDVICTTENYLLPPDVPNAALFLPNYHIYRSNRETDKSRVTNFGDVMIDINSHVSQKSVETI